MLFVKSLYGNNLISLCPASKCAKMPIFGRCAKFGKNHIKLNYKPRRCSADYAALCFV